MNSDIINKINQNTVLLAKELEHLAKENHKFNVFLARLFLRLPIPMNYETWSFLHEIADGDVE